MAVCVSCGNVQEQGKFCVGCGGSFPEVIGQAPVGETPRNTQPAIDLQTASQLAATAHAVAATQRLITTACPRCGAGLAVVRRNSTWGIVFIILGILTVWLFGLGLIFIVTGVILNILKRRNLAYQCPACNYSNA